jgi:hypothetical protein
MTLLPAMLAAPADLVGFLEQAESALARGEHDTADTAMSAAAEICRRMQSAGVPIPNEEIGALQALVARCGTLLERMAAELNAESLRDDNHRRGLLTYQASQVR